MALDGELSPADPLEAATAAASAMRNSEAMAAR